MDPKYLLFLLILEIFAKGYTPNWSEEIFVVKKIKILYLGHM